VVGEGRRARSGGRKAKGEQTCPSALDDPVCGVGRGRESETEGCGLEMCVQSEGKEGL